MGGDPNEEPNAKCDDDNPKALSCNSNSLERPTQSLRGANTLLRRDKCIWEWSGRRSLPTYLQSNSKPKPTKKMTHPILV